MMRFDMDRLRGSDPTYAPLSFRVKAYFYWRASKPAIEAGYHKKPIRLPGVAGDGQDGIRAQKARDLTIEMMEWISGTEKPKVDPDCWQWIFGRYKGDEFSPMREVKDNTARSYLDDIAYLETAIGKSRVAATDYEFVKKFQRGMMDKGRSVDFISRKFRMLRIVAHYGRSLKPKEFRDVCDVLSGIRVMSPKPKSISPSEDQIMAIVAEADKAGEKGAALGFLLQWWLTLRAVDVRGQMLGAKGQKLRWADGLTWDMVDLQAGTIRKLISKTERSDAEPMEWDIGGIPDLMDRLNAIPIEQRVGPVVRRKNGLHFTKETYTTIFRACRTAAGVSDEVKNMDTRAGAINHAKRAGATPIQLQHQANHADLKTTTRYIREKSDSASQVIEMRTRAKQA